MKRLQQFWKTFWNEDKGLGTLEMIMIIAVLVLIAFAFRKWILNWVTALFNDTNTQINDFKNNAPQNLNPPSSILFQQERGHV